MLAASPRARLVRSPQVTQHIVFCEEMDKKRQLYAILQQVMDGKNKILIFTSTKRTADQLTTSLRYDGFNCRSLHGDKGQAERDRVLLEFRQGRAPIMIATDVASRGLDVRDITIVINYDMSNTIEDYVHRVGRTGRAGDRGTAYTLFTPDNSRMARDLIKLLQESQQRVPEELYRFVGGGGRGGGRYGGGGGGGRYGGGRGGGAFSGANEVPVGGSRGSGGW
jgi:ATP-dependent RNA helicase DDX5/DBP2